MGARFRGQLGIYVFDAQQRAAAEASRMRYGEALRRAGHAAIITTEILDALPFY